VLLKTFGAFLGPSAPKALRKTFKVQNLLLPLLFFLISAVGHSSGKFFGIQENPKTRVAEHEGMRHPSPRVERGGAGPGAESVDL